MRTPIVVLMASGAQRGAEANVAACSQAELFLTARLLKRMFAKKMPPVLGVKLRTVLVKGVVPTWGSLTPWYIVHELSHRVNACSD